MDLALNNLQRLICHKTQPTNQPTIQPTNQPNTQPTNQPPTQPTNSSFKSPTKVDVPLNIDTKPLRVREDLRELTVREYLKNLQKWSLIIIFSLVSSLGHLFWGGLGWGGSYHTTNDTVSIFKYSKDHPTRWGWHYLVSRLFVSSVFSWVPQA